MLHSSELGREQSWSIFENTKLRRIRKLKKQEVATGLKKCILASSFVLFTYYH
jgi:hypothetical protein